MPLSRNKLCDASLPEVLDHPEDGQKEQAVSPRGPRVPPRAHLHATALMFNASTATVRGTLPRIAVSRGWRKASANVFV